MRFPWTIIRKQDKKVLVYTARIRVDLANEIIELRSAIRQAIATSVAIPAEDEDHVQYRIENTAMRRLREASRGKNFYGGTQS